MNSNRTRYTQTPTFGMQKRSLFGNGKKNLFQKPEPTAPDFTKAPPQAEIPNPAFFSVPAQNPMMQDSTQTMPPYAMNQVPMQGYPATPLPTGGIAMPSGYNDPMAGGFPMPNPTLGGITPQGNMGAMNGMGAVPGMTPNPGYASPNLPPLGASSQQLNAGFSARGQGFVPPQAPAAPAPAAPDVQPANVGGYDPMNYSAPAMQQNGGQPFFGQQPQQPQNPFFGQTAPQQPAPNMQQSSFMQMAAQNQMGQPRGAASMNPNMLWMVFLFGLIPLLFIPCLFVSQGLNILRYVFLVVCITGLGIMWYRQMLGPVARIIVSAVYAGMCIYIVSTLMQPVKDVQLAPTVSQNTPSAQVEFTPDPAALADPNYDLAAAAGLAAPVETPTPTPAAKSDAEVRLEFFMNYWCGNNVDEMVNLVQPSWATAQESAVTSLFNLLTNRLPLNYQIEEVMGTDDDTSRSVTMVAEIDKQNGKDPVIYRFTVLMVKEGGQWYVNPNSLATNDAVPTEDVVVNDKTQGLTTTEAPRTTVSPPPPADTVLYYNPDGGHYFHMDAYCESIKEEYRPLTGTFLYRDMRDYRNLSPCLRCGAPTSALPIVTDVPAE